MEDNLIDESPVKSKKGGINSKIFIIGVPLFIIQLVAVYFITANILLKNMEHNESKKNDEHSETSEEHSEEGTEGEKKEIGKFLFNVEDIIINPAGTNGKQLLLTSIGFDIPTETQLQDLMAKEVIIKDMIISVLSSKKLNQLSNPTFRDTLKIELTSNLKNQIPKLEINNVYFSKYIIQ